MVKTSVGVLLILFLSSIFLSFFLTQIITVGSVFDSLPDQYALNSFENKNSALKLFDDAKEDLIKSGTDFLEADLEDMKIRFWQQGSLKNEVPILAKGDPQGWGGSAAGLYKVISRNVSSYSIVSEVYMPYAVHYYGKYYFHGEPYYPNGEKRFSDITGGCIQQTDEDAKIIYDLAARNMPVLVIDKKKDSYQYPLRRTHLFPQLSAKSYLVADLDLGFVFVQKNSKEVLPIASLTQLMTSVVVAENVDLKRKISITPSMLEGYGSTQGLEPGRSFRVVELFYPLLVESSNDAAEAVSYFLGREKTIQKMNEKSKAILMENTNFADPSGNDLQNSSTAQDLFYLSRYILNNRLPVWEITRGKRVTSFGDVYFQNLDNKNIFFNDENFIGGKTGFAESFQHNGAFLFNIPLKSGSPRRIAIIVLGSASQNDLEQDVQKTLKWLKRNYFN